MTGSAIRGMKDLPSAHLLGAGTGLCAGCGGMAVLHQIYDVLGPNTVFVNAAGCMTMLASYPFTPFRGGWLFTAMACAPAGAQGVRDALDILVQTGRIASSEDMTVVVLAGDGSSYGMGLSATSAAIERGLDFIYICYDNEGYGNTGQQSSPATPYGARTADSARGWSGSKKDLFAIWTAHRPTYCATVIGAEPLDLAKKIEKLKALKGPRLLHALAPCPPGWNFGAEHLVEIGRLAVNCGVWPLKEYIDGRVIHTRVPRPRLPVEMYLQTQQRFAHLFSPRRDDAAIARIQREVDAYWSTMEG